MFRVFFHEFILQKIREKPNDRVWIKDVSNGRFECFGNVGSVVTKIASGLTKIGDDITDKKSVKMSQILRLF